MNENQKRNFWSEFLCKPKSIRFCNVDSENFYKWWNFAAIIDFKWRDFGKFYYCWIWFFYTIFILCFILATTKPSELNYDPELTDSEYSVDYTGFFPVWILFIISSLFGLGHLFFEIRQCLWKPKQYFSDAWNL